MRTSPMVIFLAALMCSQPSSARPKSGQPDDAPVDFVYVRGDAPSEIDVPFALYGSCKRSGAFVFAQQGVLLDEVVVGRQTLAKMTVRAHKHPEKPMVVSRPGDGFFYRMPLAFLASDGVGDEPGVSFRIASDAPVPMTVVVRYRIRCADGVVSRQYESRGVELQVPKAPPGAL